MPGRDRLSPEGLQEGREVQVCSDNATTVAHLNHQGGARFRLLLDLFREKVLSISAVHIKGVNNQEADILS